jgi:hypothetical protein
MPHFDADQWSVLVITVTFGAARWIVAAFAVRSLMSQLGQNRKSSLRAIVFRCSPNNGHCQDTSVCPFRGQFQTLEAAAITGESAGDGVSN